MSELQNNLSETAAGMEERVRNLDKEYSGFTDAASRAVHNGKEVAERWCKQGFSAAKDFGGTTVERIKHDPVPAAAITFGLGLVAGALIGWLLAHESGVEDIIESAQRATST
jgi:hypothetical protein